MNARDNSVSELHGPPVNPKWAARRLAASALRDGFEPQALHAYTDRDGSALYWRVRLKNPVTVEKWLRPMRREGIDYALAEPDFPGGKPLYRLDVIATDTASPIWFVEGELKADRLAALGVLATTAGSATSDERADFAPLRDRHVIAWPDHDQAGRDHMQRVAAKLRALGCTIQMVNIGALGLPEHGDVVDYLAAHPDATAAELMALPMVTQDPAIKATTDESDESLGDSIDGTEGGGKQSQASALVAFATEHVTLFHDQNWETYAKDRATKETRRLGSRQFRDWLVAAYYESTGTSARDQSLREALATMAGLGRFTGECHDVHVRCAGSAGVYFLDLCEAGNSRAIRIEAGRWEVVSNPPVRFVRPETMRPLPEPIRGGAIDTLWSLVNIPENVRLLAIAWLCECLRPDTPFPILEFLGEHGSAKSTTQSMFRHLIDPNACDLRAAPKSVEDVFVSAGVNWLVSYENISHLSAPMQDALCVLATGGGFATRTFYTNTDETVIIVKRPVVLNGISAAVTAQDLIDRTVSIETPAIEDRSETPDLWRIFNAARGDLLGALLDIMADALARLPNIHLAPADRPRLAEFARLGMAVAESMGKTGKEFMRQFDAAREECIARTIDASPVATALIEWFKAQKKRAADMPVNTLFREVERYKPPNTDAWPRSAKGFADALRRAAPALRSIDITCKSRGKVGGSVRWTVEVGGKRPDPCPASPDVLAAQTTEADPSRTLGHSGLHIHRYPPPTSGDDIEVIV